MKRLSRASLGAIAVTPYSEVRQRLRTGDVIFCAGQYAFSRLISLATGSPISHVGIVVRIDSVDRVLVLEAVENFGVRLAPISCMIDGPAAYRGMVFVARSYTVGDVAQAACWGMDHLAMPYSYATILALAVRLVLGSARRSDPDKVGFICSEFAAQWLALALGRAELFPDGERLLTPADLWGHSSLSLFARLR